jgi:uncharacterized protein (DUF2147 family)
MQTYNQKLTKLMLMMLVFELTLTASAQTSNSILGKWKDAEHPEKQIEIINQAGKFLGKGINSSKPSENAKTILKDLVWSESSKSYTGILINPDNGDEFKIEIIMVGVDRFKFTVGKFIFSRTFTFNRIAQ